MNVSDLKEAKSAAQVVYLRAIKERWPAEEFKRAERGFWDAWRVWREAIEPRGPAA